MLPPAPPGPKAIPGGVCALMQEGRAGQLVLEIRPRHPRTAPLLRDRAVVDGTCASPLETGVLQPRKKMPCILQSVQTAESSCLPLGRVVSFGVLVTTPHFLLLIPLVELRADAGPRSWGWELHPLQHTGTRENTALLAFLFRGAVPAPGFIVAGLLQEGGQPAVTCCHRLFLRARSSPPFSLG